MNIPKKAQLVRQYRYVVFSHLRLSEPTNPTKTWGDITLEQYFEDTKSDKPIAFEFLSAMRLYEHGNYAQGCHLATIRTAIKALDAGLNAYCQFRHITKEQIDAMPPKGAVGIALKTLVPREQKSKIQAAVTMYANDEKLDEVDQLADATNPAMVFQLGHALNQLYSQAMPASAVVPPPT